MYKLLSRDQIIIILITVIGYFLGTAGSAILNWSIFCYFQICSGIKFYGGIDTIAKAIQLGTVGLISCSFLIVVAVYANWKKTSFIAWGIEVGLAAPALAIAFISFIMHSNSSGIFGGIAIMAAFLFYKSTIDIKKAKDQFAVLKASNNGQ